MNHRQPTCIAIAWLALAPVFVTAEEPPPEVIVVCPQSLQAEITPWVEYRRAGGYRVAVTGEVADGETIRSAIRDAAAAAKSRGSRLAAILLVGDVAHREDQAKHAVPTHLAKAKINIRWGSEPQIATDNWYADLDGDDVPDVPIGRFSVDSPNELKQVVAKTIAYEQQSGFGLWRRRLHFIAGVGGFGKLADSVLESGTRYFLTQGIPAAYRSTMTYANWRSPYCPDPSRFRESIIQKHNEGCLFWVYIGHGQKTHLDVMRTPAGGYPILSNRDVPQLTSAQGSPVALFLSCYAGAFDQPEDCLAEMMLRQESGPVAVIAGSRVTMPYAMAVMGSTMLEECFERRTPTVGQMLLAAKRRMAADDEQTPNRDMLDSIASVISPAPVDLRGERMEHLHLFNLLGDPLLSIRHPQAMEVSTVEGAAAGEEIEITATSPIAGRCRIELIVQRDRLTFTPPERNEFRQDAQARAATQAVYHRANDPRLVSGDLQVESGEFRTRLTIPAEASGPCHVSVFVEGEDDFAVGACDIRVRE